MRISRNQVKYLQSLKLKKYRQKYESFLAEGRKVVLELMSNKKLFIKSLYALESWIDEHNYILKDLSIPVYVVRPAELSQISSFKTPDTVCAEFSFMADQEDFKGANGWILYLDNLNDPGNAGSIIRSADWFGIRSICFSPESVDMYNPKTIQATMGSFGRIPCYYLEHTVLRTLCPEFEWYHADLNGTSMSTIGYPDRGVLVIGSESHGISPDLNHLEHRTVSIMKSPGSKAESLNASVATAVILSHITRFRKPS